MTDRIPPCGHSNGTHPSGCWYVAVCDAVAAERARIVAAVEGIGDNCHSRSGLMCDREWDVDAEREYERRCTSIDRFAVLRIIEDRP